MALLPVTAKPRPLSTSTPPLRPRPTTLHIQRSNHGCVVLLLSVLPSRTCTSARAGWLTVTELTSSLTALPLPLCRYAEMETTVPCGDAAMPRVGLGVWKVPKDITAATVVEVRQNSTSEASTACDVCE